MNCIIRALCCVLAGLALTGCINHRVVGTYFQSDGVPIHYTDQGAGEPVILVHGIAVNADLNWRRPGILKRLAKDYRVIALDNRGHGLSGKPHDPGAYGAALAEDIPRLMDHLGIQRAHLVGYSMGAFIALKLAASHPNRFVTIIPCGGGWERTDETGLAQLEAIALEIETERRFNLLLREVGLTPRGFDRVKVFVVNRVFRCINDTDAIAAVVRSLPELEVGEAELRANQVPVLFAVGEHDPLRRGLENLEGVMQGHEIVYIRGGNHYSTLKRIDLVAAIRDFIEAHRDNKASTGGKT